MESRAVKHISMIITSRCNLKCKHCYVDNKLFERQLDDDIIFNRIAAACPETLYVSGGEPLLVEDITKYIRFCQEYGVKLSVCTNGTIDNNMVTQLMESDIVENIVIGAELPFSVYKLLRGNDYVSVVKDNIRRWVAMSSKIMIDCTLVSQNSALSTQIVEEAWELGVRQVSLKRFRPIGRGKRHKKLLEVKPLVYFDALLQWAQMAVKLRNKMKLTSEDPIFKVIGAALLDIPMSDFGGDLRGCLAGTSWLGIMPNGDVYPCPLMLYSSFPPISLYDKSLQEIATAGTIRKFCDSSRINGCRDCQFAEICRGCRVHAYADTGNFWARDPYCPLEWIRFQTNS